MAVAFIGIGSNLGKREGYIAKAIDLLNKNRIAVLKQATAIETDPVDAPMPQGKFLNTVIKIKTDLDPHQLLDMLLKIEKECGRKRSVKNAPRTLDLDILLYENIKISTPELTVPHPRMLTRDFVLIPLKEIAPEIFDKITHANN